MHWPATNLRELGGYPTPDGTIRRGVLFRGGRMNELDAEGLAVHRGLGLRTILDLRRPDEVAEAPTPRFGGERNVHISVSNDTNAFGVAAAQADDPGQASEVLATAAAYYRSLVVEQLPRWRPVVDHVLDADGSPLLFHCTAGKDRTGFLAAMLLKFLDVDDATVFEDFELTNSVRKPWVDERLEHHRRRIADERGLDPDEVPMASLDAWRTLMTAPAPWLQAAFDAVGSTYGDWHTMRREGLGVDDDRLAAWRSRVVE